MEDGCEVGFPGPGNVTSRKGSQGVERKREENREAVHTTSGLVREPDSR
jgi:hypothetical protein